MDVFFRMVSLQLMLFCLMAAGVLLRKTGLVDGQGRKLLSDLLIDVILPCGIVQAFLGGIRLTGELMRSCGQVFLAACVIQAAAAAGGRLLFARYPRAQQSVLRYGLICSNATFIGLPVAEVLYGDLGVLYTTLFQIPLRFTMWTAGLSLFTAVSRREALGRLARHPCILAIFAGVFLMVLPVSLPGFAADSIRAVGQCTTPVSMFVIGAVLADAPVKSLFSRTVLWYSFVRLLAFPLLVWLALRPLGLEPAAACLCVLLTAMPAGSTTSILADKYGCDAAFAAQITFTSTLLSLATIPLLTLLMNG